MLNGWNGKGTVGCSYDDCAGHDDRIGIINGKGDEAVDDFLPRFRAWEQHDNLYVQEGNSAANHSMAIELPII